MVFGVQSGVTVPQFVNFLYVKEKGDGGCPPASSCRSVFFWGAGVFKPTPLPQVVFIRDSGDSGSMQFLLVHR